MHPMFYRKWAKRLAMALACGIGLWALGAFDYLFLEDFDTSFEWTPRADVLRRQIHLEETGQLAASAEIYPLNDWTTFEPLIKPSIAECPKGEHKKNAAEKGTILIVVRSAPDRKERRLAIRASWGLNGAKFGAAFWTFFVMGHQLGTIDHRPELLEESKRYPDLLVGNFVDHYNNSTHKTLQALHFAREHCATSSSNSWDFLLLLDDDELFFPWNLAEAIQHWVPNEHLYTGDAYVGALPARLALSKWQISLGEYPYNHFPPYIQGNAVLMSRRTVREFHTAIKYAKLFVWDDVFLGILAHQLGILVRHEPRMPRHLGWRWRWGWTRAKSLSSTSMLEPRLICAHGFSPDQMRAIYAEMCADWQQQRTIAAAADNNEEWKC